MIELTTRRIKRTVNIEKIEAAKNHKPRNEILGAMSFDKILYPSAKRGAGPQVSSQKVRPGSFKLCRLPPGYFAWCGELSVKRHFDAFWTSDCLFADEVMSPLGSSTLVVKGWPRLLDFHWSDKRVLIFWWTHGFENAMKWITGTWSVAAIRSLIKVAQEL